MPVDRADIKTYLSNYANSETSPKFAVLIEGEWGCGKTHFVKSIIEDKSFTSKKIVYLSLFGVGSTESLETQLFFASASTGAKLLHNSARIFGTAVKAGFRVDINGDGKPDANVNSGFGGLDSFVQNTLNNLDSSVLVLDDLERCEIPIPELLGVINGFIEHGDTRVILIANSKKLEDTKFAEFREKIIGHSFML